MKKILLPILTVGLLSSLAGCSDINDELKTLSEDTNKQLPKKLNPFVTMEKTESKDHGFSIFYTMTRVTAEEIDDDTIATTKQMVVDLTCKDGDIKDYLEQDVEITYVLNDKNGEHVRDISVKKKDCPEL
jgi:uncharacterized OsmC-like protein